MAETRDIFLVCNNVEELGGLQRWAHDIGRLFAARGHRVHLVGITHADRPHDYGRDLPYTVTVLHERQPAPARGPLGDRLRTLRHRRMVRRGAARLSALFRTARSGGVVIAAQVWAMEWVARADTAGMPVIGMSHESYEATRRSSRYERVKRHFADADLLLALTDADADAWAFDGMSNAAAMPNPLHVTPRTVSPRTEPVVVRHGRLSFEKGQDMLLESWAEVASRHPSWRLRLYGSGPEDAALREQAAGLGLSGSVEFAGPTSDIESALTGASIFALSSREEGFPMSIIEAMAYGLPTVAFDCAPGVSELLTDGRDGLIVSPGNTAEFAAALDRLIRDAGLRDSLAEAARESVRRYEPDAILDRWERQFALVAGGKDRAVPPRAVAAR
ncbi:glycosyltransferase [Actinoallomurus sp. NPDC052308]|uniref:glycosyltransferase n=1 Tax=Actinoallomurus sp. NPDC052308 TaxID=3155530 RepID=UPI00341FB90F